MKTKKSKKNGMVELKNDEKLNKKFYGKAWEKMKSGFV